MWSIYEDTHKKLAAMKSTIPIARIKKKTHRLGNHLAQGLVPLIRSRVNPVSMGRKSPSSFWAPEGKKKNRIQMQLHFHQPFWVTSWKNHQLSTSIVPKSPQYFANNKGFGDLPLKMPIFVGHLTCIKLKQNLTTEKGDSTNNQRLTWPSDVTPKTCIGTIKSKAWIFKGKLKAKRQWQLLSHVVHVLQYVYTCKYLYIKQNDKHMISKGAKVNTRVSKLNLNTSPFRTIFLVTGCFSVVPPTITIELLTTTQANSIWESGFGIGGNSFHFILSSSM